MGFAAWEDQEDEIEPAFLAAMAASEDADALHVQGFEDEFESFMQETPEMYDALILYVEARARLLSKRRSEDSGTWEPGVRKLRDLQARQERVDASRKGKDAANRAGINCCSAFPVPPVQSAVRKATGRPNARRGMLPMPPAAALRLTPRSRKPSLRRHSMLPLRSPKTPSSCN